MEELVIYGSHTDAKLVSGNNHMVGDFIISCTELHSGTHISSFKQCSVPVGGLGLSRSHILAAQAGKALMHIYSFAKEGIEQKVVLPEQLCSISVSPSNTWLAGGSSGGRLYLWDLRSGDLIFVRDAHFRDITHIKFTSDESYLFTGSADSRVLGWEVQNLVQSDAVSDEVEPAFTWADHSLAVTGLEISMGKFSESNVYTASQDSTVRCWNLQTNLLVTTFVLPEPVTALEIDKAERVLYCGLSSGKIQIIPLYETNRQTGKLELIGGAGRIVTIVDQSTSLVQHQAPITALQLSFDATVLISGDQVGKVYTWDLPDMQVSRSLKQHRGPISTIYTVPRVAGGVIPVPPQFPPLKRTLDTDSQRNITVQIQNSKKNHASGYRGGLFESSEVELKAVKLQEDLGILYSKYSELKTIHEDLWKLHVKSTNV